MACTVQETQTVTRDSGSLRGTQTGIIHHQHHQDIAGVFVGYNLLQRLNLMPEFFRIGAVGRGQRQPGIGENLAGAGPEASLYFLGGGSPSG